MRVTVTVLLSILLIASCPVSAASLKPSDFKGLAKCGVMLYQWPKSTGSLPTLVAHGTLEVEGDGNGKWEKGELTVKVVGKVEDREMRSCSFILTDGKYEIKSETGLLSTITWKLAKGDPATCNRLIGGYVSQDIKAVGSISTSSVPVYTDANGKLQQLSFGPEGFGTGTCAAASAK
jgi:hypothetical protein